jgi:glycosyltransferase involved in cell wall biosynthesis
MTARAPRVLMPGTAPEGRGGVAALVAVLRAGGLFDQARVRYISTHREGSFFSRLEAAARGFWQAIACLWRRPAIVHAHAASQAGFARKSQLLWLAPCAGCQTIFHLHGGGFRQFATVRSGLLMRRWIRHTLEPTSLVIARTGGRAGFVRGFAPRARVTVVPNAVPLPQRSVGRAEPGRILFLGRLEQARGVAELFDAAALLEAMAAGKAVVASRGGGIPEAVRDGENGLLVPPRDARALATALARLLEDAGLRARLGERARDTVAQHYSTETVCGRLAAIYNDLAGAR